MAILLELHIRETAHLFEVITGKEHVPQHLEERFLLEDGDLMSSVLLKLNNLIGNS